MLIVMPLPTAPVCHSSPRFEPDSDTMHITWQGSLPPTVCWLRTWSCGVPRSWKRKKNQNTPTVSVNSFTKRCRLSLRRTTTEIIRPEARAESIICSDSTPTIRETVIYGRYGTDCNRYPITKNDCPALQANSE